MKVGGSNGQCLPDSELVDAIDSATCPRFRAEWAMNCSATQSVDGASLLPWLHTFYLIVAFALLTMDVCWSIVIASVNVTEVEVLTIRRSKWSVRDRIACSKTPTSHVAERRRIQISSLQPAFHRTLDLVPPLGLDRQNNLQRNDDDDLVVIEIDAGRIMKSTLRRTFISSTGSMGSCISSGEEKGPWQRRRRRLY